MSGGEYLRAILHDTVALLSGAGSVVLTILGEFAPYIHPEWGFWAWFLRFGFWVIAIISFAYANYHVWLTEHEALESVGVGYGAPKILIDHVWGSGDPHARFPIEGTFLLFNRGGGDALNVHIEALHYRDIVSEFGDVPDIPSGGTSTVKAALRLPPADKNDKVIAMDASLHDPIPIRVTYSDFYNVIYETQCELRFDRGEIRIDAGRTLLNARTWFVSYERIGTAQPTMAQRA